MSNQAKCFRCGKPVLSMTYFARNADGTDAGWMCGDCYRAAIEIEPPKPHEPHRTRLVEPVECGLGAEDRETLAWLVNYTVKHFDEERPMHGRVFDLLDRLPDMVKQRDEELADHEYHTLCAKLEADTCRQILADAIAQSNGSRDLQQSVTDGFENLAKTITMAWEERDRLQREIEHLRGLLDGQDRRHSGTSDDETIHRLDGIDYRRMYEAQADLTGSQRAEIERLRGLLDGESHG